MPFDSFPGYRRARRRLVLERAQLLWFMRPALRERFAGYRLAARARRDVAIKATVVVTLAAALPPAALLSLVAAAPYIDADARFAELERLHRRGLGVEVVDSRGRWDGIIPSSLLRPDVSEPSRPDDPTYKTLGPESIPAGWWAVLVALEDRHLGQRTIACQDVARILWLIAKWPIGLAGGGGSGVASQVTRSLHGWSPDGDAGFVAKLRRKIVEFVDGATLCERLGGPEGLAMWAAAHLPIAIGFEETPIGGEIRGIETAARVFWSTTASRLSLAQQAVWAAAIQKHVLIAPPGNPKLIAVRDERWNYIRRRAARGLVLAFGADDPQVKVALAELATMPVPVPRLDPAFAELLADAPAQALAVAANPELRATIFARGEIIQALAELDKRDGPDAQRRLKAIHLSIDTAANLRFKRAVEERLRELEARFADRLALRLSPGSDTPHADVLVAVADERGRVLRFYSNSGRAIWSDADRRIGSLGKIAAVLALAERGDRADTLYCNRSLYGTINAGGDFGVTDCAAAGARLPARTVVAQSLNLPIISALSPVPEPRLREIAAALGLALESGTPAKIALALGHAAASPQTLLATARVVANIAEGRPGDALIPSLVASTAHKNDVASAGLPPGGDLPRLHFETTESLRRNAHFLEVLQAPLDPRGTLAPLGRWARGHPEIRHFIAKSGTTDASNYETRDKWALGAFTLHQSRYAFVVLVGSPLPSQPLGRRIPATLTSTLAAEAIGGLLTPHQPQGNRP